MIKYNLDFLVKVEVNDFKKANWYYYKKEKKILNFVLNKEGVYLEVWNTYKGKAAPKNNTIINNVVMRNPRCILHYVDGSSEIYYFDNYKKAIEFSNKFTVDKKWIE